MISLRQKQMIHRHPVRHLRMVLALKFQMQDRSVRQQKQQIDAPLLNPWQFHVQELQYGNAARQTIQQSRPVLLEQVFQRAVEIETVAHLQCPSYNDGGAWSC